MAQYATVIGIYHIQYKGVQTKRNVEYHFTGLNKWQLVMPFYLSFYVKDLRPDVVIVHGLRSPWQILLLRLVIGPLPTLIVQHHAGRPLRDFRQYLQRWADKYIDRYLFVSLEQGREWVVRKQISAIDKVTEVMEASSTFGPTSKAGARERTGVRGERVYLWVGRLDDNKDPLAMARAFATFAQSHKGAELYMIYASSELEASLEAFLLTSGCEQIHLLGEVSHPEMQWWYSSADFIVSTSHYEGSGIAVCEAISCGCIPILSSIPSFRMMCDDGQLGLLFEPGDHTGLVAALEKSMALELLPESEKSLAKFQRDLSFDAIARKIMKAVNELRS
jgi:glycosyltransferase involved in cell wall biosynthesis